MARRSPFKLALKSSFFALLALGSLAMAGCRHRDRERQEDPQAWAWQGELAAPGTLQIRNTLGSITVEPATDNTVSVVASASWTRGDPKRDLQFRGTTSGTTMTVCAIWGRGECSDHEYTSRSRRGGTRSDAEVDFTVKVPAGVRVDAWTLSGDVTVRAAGPVKARTMSGDILAGTSVGPVDAESVSGDVDVRMTTIGEVGDVRAVTKSGDAVAYVPEIVDGRIDASTLNGEIGSDFGTMPVSSQRIGRKLETTLGAGSRTYTVQSLNGSAWLRLINADGSVAPARERVNATKATASKVLSPK
jgi:hypothetical protein